MTFHADKPRISATGSLVHVVLKIFCRVLGLVLLGFNYALNKMTRFIVRKYSGKSEGHE